MLTGFKEDMGMTSINVTRRMRGNYSLITNGISIILDY